MLEITGFNLQNPWRVGQFTAPKTYPRKILAEALDWLARDEIIVIIGPRQVGKTTLLYQLIEHLLAHGTDPADVFYFTLDEPGLIDFFRSPADFIHFINNRPVPVEVKFTGMKSPTITRSYRSFLATYSPKIGIIFTKDFLGETTIDSTRILFLPLWSLAFVDLKDCLHF